MDYKDIIYEKSEGIARIIINRPRYLNAFTAETLEEMIEAFDDANDDNAVGVIVLSGAGGEAFSTGGDVSFEKDLSSATGRRLIRKLLRLADCIRNNGKPVIAAIRGYVIGGGNELNMLCDLSIATKDSRFGQVGPKMGSTPVWYGTQLLTRVVGEKRAREIVYLCHQYTAQEALEMGWINKIVEDHELEDAVQQWCQELLDKSSQSLRIAKSSFNSDTDQLYGSIVQSLYMLSMTYDTEEFKEGTAAFLEKRRPNFRKFRK